MQIRGLHVKGNVAWLDKTIGTRRYQISSHISRLDFRTETEFQKAVEPWFFHLCEEIRKADGGYRARRRRTFADGARQYIEVAGPGQRDIRNFGRLLDRVCGSIGQVQLRHITGDHPAVRKIVIGMSGQGRSNKTINAYLEAIRRVLRFCATHHDEWGLTWLETAPKIKMLDLDDARKPRVLTWQEQPALLSSLPTHLQSMVLFCLNTGLRDSEMCGLQWNQMVESSLGSIFIIQGAKTQDQRPVILNKVARTIVTQLAQDYAPSRSLSEHGLHHTNPRTVTGLTPTTLKDQAPSLTGPVFRYKGNRMERMNNSAWKKARARRGDTLRVHDLRHTFGHRLRSVGCPQEDISVLLGHRTKTITEHYSQADIEGLSKWVEMIAEPRHTTPYLEVVRGR